MVTSSGLVMKEAIASPGVNKGTCSERPREIVIEMAVNVLTATKTVTSNSKIGETATSKDQPCITTLAMIPACMAKAANSPELVHLCHDILKSARNIYRKIPRRALVKTLVAIITPVTLV